MKAMGFIPVGCGRELPEEERRNAFALVIYIPDPLGAFLDDLRRLLVPAYKPHAHVSVLPPRPLMVDWRTACAEVEAVSGSRDSFEVELADVQVFPATDVVYLEVGKGSAELRSLHTALNRESFEFQEPYVYHPHITLAQGLTHDEVGWKYELACRRWQEFKGSRSFRAERAVLVQNTITDCWVDLAEYSLGRTLPLRAKI